MKVELVLVVIGALALVELASRGKTSRLAWRAGCRFYGALELASRRVLRLALPPRFTIVGECVQCGDCCKHIVGKLPRFISGKLARELFVRWHLFAHAFRVVGRGEDGELVFACGHLGPDNRCGIYRRRPVICRDYPLLPAFAAPAVLPRCSYGVAPREVARMRRRASLPIVNPGVSVHHPPRGHDGLDEPEDFELVDLTGQ